MANEISGFAICIHNCDNRWCRNSAGSIIWSRYGNPLRKHATSIWLHPNCDPECPGYTALKRKRGEYVYHRILTVGQVEEMQGNSEDDAEMTVDGDRDGSDNHGDNIDDMDVDRNDPPTTLFADPVSRLSAIPIAANRNPSQGSDNNPTIDLNTEISQFETPITQAALGNPTEPYRLIYVPDPTRYGTRETAPSDLAFIKTTISIIEWRKIKHLNQSVFLLRHKKSTGEVTVYMQEWLCLVIRLSQTICKRTCTKLFSVEYVNWEDFRDAMVNNDYNGSFWAKAALADCLIGGVDISLSYLNDKYNLNEEQYRQYLYSLKWKVQLVAYVWPPVEHLECGSKERLLGHLDIIARMYTRTPRPSWKILKHGMDIPEGTVIKRSHSDCGGHVLLPDSPLRNWNYLDSETIPESVWFSQEYIPQLIHLGEWRAFIVGGLITYVVHTRYDKVKRTWSWEPADTYYSLDEFNELEHTQGLLTLPRICNPDDGDMQLREQARAEFFDFVNKTFLNLLQIESRLLTSRPSIGIFCRLDIGLMVANGRVNYFVNEVERTQTASLWNNPPKGTKYFSRIGLIGATFANSFHKWVSGMKQPILA